MFAEGEYLPLVPSGGQRRHVCAFLRRAESSWVLTAVPRLIFDLVPHGFALGESVWQDTVLQLPQNAPDSWVNLFTGSRVTIRRDPTSATVRAADLFATFPVALLEGITGGAES